MSFGKRRKTVTTFVGGVAVGSAAPVVVQSMPNTDTADPVATGDEALGDPDLEHTRAAGAWPSASASGYHGQNRTRPL